MRLENTGWGKCIMKIVKRKVTTAFFIVAAGMLLISPGVKAAFAEVTFDDEVAAYYDAQSHGEMAEHMRVMHFTKAGRFLQSRLQEQKAFFGEKHGTETNGIAEKAEELVDEANLLASENNLDDGIKILVSAHQILTTSLKEMNGH